VAAIGGHSLTATVGELAGVAVGTAAPVSGADLKAGTMGIQAAMAMLNSVPAINSVSLSLFAVLMRMLLRFRDLVMPLLLSSF
jgi:uncharacterized membrane protein YraQ (UPF0718 family)